MSANYTFTWPSGPSDVILTGSFDDWKKTLPLVKQADGSFSLTVPLPANDKKVLYKYVVDGVWKLSSSDRVEKGPDGVENNVLDPADLVLVTNGIPGLWVPESGGLVLAIPVVDGTQANTENTHKITVMPKEPVNATIAGEPGIFIPTDPDALAAFSKIEPPRPTETVSKTPEELKKEREAEKKKAKRNKYKAKKKAAGKNTKPGASSSSDEDDNSVEPVKSSSSNDKSPTKATDSTEKSSAKDSIDVTPVPVDASVLVPETIASTPVSKDVSVDSKLDANAPDFKDAPTFKHLSSTKEGVEGKDVNEEVDSKAVAAAASTLPVDEVSVPAVAPAIVAPGPIKVNDVAENVAPTPTSKDIATKSAPIPEPEPIPTPAAVVPEPIPAPAAIVPEPVPAPAAIVPEPIPAPAPVVPEPVPAPIEPVSEPIAAPAPVSVPVSSEEKTKTLDPKSNVVGATSVPQSEVEAEPAHAKPDEIIISNGATEEQVAAAVKALEGTDVQVEEVILSPEEAERLTREANEKIATESVAVAANVASPVVAETEHETVTQDAAAETPATDDAAEKVTTDAVDKDETKAALDSKKDSQPAPKAAKEETIENKKRKNRVSRFFKKIFN